MLTTFSLTSVCPKSVTIATQNGRCLGFQFQGGCQGNLKALSSMCQGMPIADIIQKLENIQCGNKGTSCAAELAKRLRSLSN